MSDSSVYTRRSIILSIFFLAVAALSTCEKYPKTVLIQTGAIDTVTAVSAIIEGVIVDPGDGINQYGHCWSVHPDEPTADLPTSTKKGSSESKSYFPSELSGLTPDTIYLVRAYAITDDVTVYGKTEEFRTPVQKPWAAFKASKTHIGVYAPVVFTDESMNYPTEWKWEFGDEGTSFEQNPTHAYKNPGAYNVTLTVSNESGSATLTKPDYITAGYPPFPNFNANNINPQVAESIQFIDQSVHSPISWNWDFGDGGTSAEQNPTHSYITEGTYSITLTVTNEFGSNTQTKTNYITVYQSTEPPVAEFTSDKTRSRENESVSFSDQSTNDPTNWLWNFGDGNTSTDQNPTHVYEAAGKYTVALRVSNSLGSDEEIKPDLITVVVIDIEFNEYEAVKIGNQIWMAENLKVRYYADGTPVPHVPQQADWQALSITDKAYSYQDNSIENLETYGALYSWAAAMNGAPGSDENPSGVQGVCPSGWHLPSDEEWKQLEISLGMSQADVDNTGSRGDKGGGLKETGELHWNSPNVGANNITGFTAIGTGLRKHDGSFLHLGLYSNFWTTSESEDQDAWIHGLEYYSSAIVRLAYIKVYGFPLRCVKNDQE